ncbi:DUF2585 family protein [Candidatus Kaiserbacteria bacterium]|nr:DUF2585 family protein [Candidatus Kaiserbacteria bacterium]
MSTRISIGIAALLALQAFVLHMLGQPWVSESGLMLFAGDVHSVENSQQLSDWYTLSHIIHGFIFYLALWYFFPRMPVFRRLALAVGIEVAWEVAENTPTVINHYREQALAQGYTGDSIINSLSDTCAMIAGFFFASRAPVLATIALALGLELWVAYWIRDNLFLNVVGLFHQFDFIAQWQAGS